MIVDMVRNDLGRIARAGSVRVERLFEIEAYPTVWQMTGSVACASAVAGVEPIFEALFPAASITGAPKCAAMGIIAREECSPRGIYTGAIGFVAPRRRARFSVAIRTFAADSERRSLTYGTGGGIVWDSDAAEEWAECSDKARVLAQAPLAAPLRETLRWERAGGFAALAQHLARLGASAERFAYRCDLAGVRAQLAAAAAGWRDGAPRLVRLTMSPAGACDIAAAPLAPLPSPYRLGLAAAPVDERDLLLYHKTARRERYAAALAARPDCDDVLLWNGRGEVTESCIANLLFERDGSWWTPPLRCGLLPGLQRAALLASGAVREGVLRVEELAAVGRLHLVNAVRGRWEAHWTPARSDGGYGKKT
jgi:para-aminobenzoate synthetase/4-amino-4-deoxychorismate lyase